MKTAINDFFKLVKMVSLRSELLAPTRSSNKDTDNSRSPKNVEVLKKHGLQFYLSTKPDTRSHRFKRLRSSHGRTVRTPNFDVLFLKAE